MARGLLDDDGEWNERLRYASTWSNASNLRDMFVTMLMFCEVSDPLDMWNKNWENLSDDILYKRRKITGNPNLQMTVEEIKNAALCEIELLLNDNNLSLTNFSPMPLPGMSTHYHVNNRLVQEELDYDHSELEREFSELHGHLNEEQRFVFDKVVHAVDSKEGGLYFVYGSGGTGKIVLAVASSGIASLLLPGGRTAHSRFKIPLEKTDLAQLIQRADLVVWDEAPMNHRNIFEAVDKTFQDLMHDADGHIFGGKTILLGGDFRQTLPVVSKGSREDVVAASISRSYLWSKCQIFILKANMRLRNNNLKGRIPTRSVNEYDDSSWIKIPEDLLIENNGDPIQQIVETIYPDVSTRFAEPNYLKDRCILTPTNDCVDSVNQAVLSRIPMASRIYASLWCPQSFVGIKVGIPVMLIRNINPSKGLCNGTRLVVTGLEPMLIWATIITDSKIGSKVTIHRVVASSAPTKWEFILQRRQFPLKVCFAMTINKSQGQTLQHVGIYLPQPRFQPWTIICCCFKDYNT
ncbi:hypothetical protein AQUCO_05900055v1 [Aquilegia coerulea]|uniref:ATP-dependent DNA helicase n=1 Tax=Aquilegia coerulea TaxID=218851 RepID=A0A2G5CE57_AQUCA|nr:hypothetical protein AQUCO_05900055v1 [Aquilegia coerulea]